MIPADHRYVGMDVVEEQLKIMQGVLVAWHERRRDADAPTGDGGRLRDVEIQVFHHGRRLGHLLLLIYVWSFGRMSTGAGSKRAYLPIPFSSILSSPRTSLRSVGDMSSFGQELLRSSVGGAGPLGSRE